MLGFAVLAALVLLVPLAGADALPPQGDMTVEATSVDGATVSFPEDGKSADNCLPASGSVFALGATTVICAPADAPPFTFVVSVVDTTSPVFGALPSLPPVDASSASGATVAYDTPSATDLFPVDVACSPASMSTFPLGVTTVTCNATDANHNSSSASFTVTVTDTTAPVLDPMPAPATVEATSSAGAVVSFAAPGATDLFSVGVVCTPPSGSTFPFGNTTVTCVATDANGNSSSGSFTVTVTDTTKPVLDAMPTVAPVEATSPAGALVHFATPGATDLFPVGVVCVPAADSVFAVGKTPVTCTATDAHGNAASNSFFVTVKDTTPPIIAVPGPITVTAPDAAGASVAYGATATDTVDGVVPVTCLPASGFVFKVGTTTVHCNAKDSKGNAAPEATFTVTVGAPIPGFTPPPSTTPVPPVTPPPPTAPTTTAPFQPPLVPPSAFRAKPGDRRITLTWVPPAGAGVHVEIVRVGAGAGSGPIYSGSATSFVDTKLRNGIKYHYAIVSVDAGGARSGAVSLTAAPKASLLVSPAAGARLAAPPTLVWVPAPRASYYNVQLYRDGRKILSTWPGRTRFALKRRWTFAGRRVSLTPGVYRWIVWPGFGPHLERKYGSALGESSFTLSG